MEDDLTAYIETALTTDAEIAAIFDQTRSGAERDVEDWYYASSSLGLGENPAVPDYPYMVWNEGNDVPFREVEKATNATRRNFRFYVYDHKGDFTRINSALRLVRNRIKLMAPFVTEEGIKCHESKWLGLSGNLVDDGYDACLRYGFGEFTVSD